MQNTVLDIITSVVGKSSVLINEPMRNHTTFRIGGCADFLIEPENSKQITELIKALNSNNIPFFVMGNGSNLLVGDKGIRGAVIKISNAMSECIIDGESIKAGCGVKLSRLANEALSNSLTGLEFASGIPGTLGGAVFMNAGAYGGEMKDVVEKVTYIDIETCDIVTVSAKQCDFGYRHSVFSDAKSIIIEAELKLKKGDKEQIRADMRELASKRTQKQPIDMPSAGSTFKRPEGYFAGTMIDECGLKGHRVGGAEVSVKHAGFIINAENATANDVRELIAYVQDTVKERFGVRLEPEVRFVGEF